MKNFKKAKGFTLIEILVVIGIIAVLAAIVIIAINPARQFAQARDSQRTSNINSILNAIGQRIADNKGIFAGATPSGTCPTIPVNSTTTIVTSGGGAGDLSCLAPTYIGSLPFDPSAGAGTITGYVYFADGNGRVHVIATSTETSIPRTSQLEVVR